MRAATRTAVLATLVAAVPVLATAQTIVITDAKLYPVSGPVIERGTIVIRDGRIAAVGAEVAVPGDARVINGAGKVVTPGLLESYTNLGIVEIGAVAVTNDLSSGDDRVTAAFDVAYALNPHSTLIPVARAGGLTRAVVAPRAGASLIAGQGALIRLDGGSTAEMVVSSPVAMFATLQDTAIESAGGGARGVAFLRLREALEDAREFADNRAAFQRRATREFALSRLDLAALTPVVRGELPLAVQVNRAADIEATLRLGREFGLRLVLLGVAEGWRVADQIAAAGVPVVVNPLANVPSFDALAATLENAARLRRAGVTVALSTFQSHNARNLRFAAGNAVANGMSFAEALDAVTLAPARIWGVADRYGSLEAGKVADVVVWDGDPFELTTGAEHVFVEGREVSLETREAELVARYRHLDGPMPPAYRH